MNNLWVDLNWSNLHFQRNHNNNQRQVRRRKRRRRRRKRNPRRRVQCVPRFKWLNQRKKWNWSQNQRMAKFRWILWSPRNRRVKWRSIIEVIIKAKSITNNEKYIYIKWIHLQVWVMRKLDHLQELKFHNKRRNSRSKVSSRPLWRHST